MKKSVIILGILIILSLSLFIYFMDSLIILVCSMIAFITAIYFLTSFYFSKKIDLSKQRHYPAPFLLFTIVLPMSIGILLLYFETFSWILVILLTSLTIVFFYNFLMIPVAIASKYQEEKKEKRLKSYPEVSIITPAYNEENTIEKCIEALIETNYPEEKKEIIIVDDGSTDNTLKEAKKYENENVKVFHKENGGKHSALNYGLMFAEGDIIISVDADSIVSRKAIKLMVKSFQDSPETGAVAGNVKVRNKESFLCRCQALEYLVGINLFRRALNLFGSVSVVPGCLGAFRKKLLDGSGLYDPDTLTEDFDVTVKMRKLGKIVQASNQALVYTEVPRTLKDLYKQRIRWYRGTFQTLIKHKNIISNPRFGLLRTLSYPFLLASIGFLPFAGMIVLISIILSLLEGVIFEVLGIFLFFNVLMFLTSLLAVRLEEGEEDLLWYSPFLMFGYKHLLDVFKMKALIDVMRGKTEWTSPERKSDSSRE